LRIFLHAPDASQELARILWKWLHEIPDPKEVYTRRTLEDMYWIGMIFGILNLSLVQKITSLSQPGVLHTMPNELYQKHIKAVKTELMKKLDGRILV
jgi:hypothetical protein